MSVPCHVCCPVCIAHTEYGTYGTQHIRHTAHVLCPRLSCVCIAMFCARTHTTARLCPFGCRVFLGEYSFGRFPICSQERRHSVWGWSVHTQFIPAVQCSMSLLPRQRRRRGISSATGQLPPPLWLAGSGQTLDSGSPLHGGTTNNQHLNAHTLLSSGDPDQ